MKTNWGYRTLVKVKVWSDVVLSHCRCKNVQRTQSSVSRSLPLCLTRRIEVMSRQRLVHKSCQQLCSRKPKTWTTRIFLRSWKDSRDAVYTMEYDLGIKRNELLVPATKHASQKSCWREEAVNKQGSCCVLCTSNWCQNSPDNVSVSVLAVPIWFVSGQKPPLWAGSSFRPASVLCWPAGLGHSGARLDSWWFKPLHPGAPGARGTFSGVDHVLGHGTVLSKS